MVSNNIKCLEILEVFKRVVKTGSYKDVDVSFAKPIYLYWLRLMNANQPVHILCTTVQPYNRISCGQVYELPQSQCSDNREGTLFSRLHIYYAHLASVRFENCVCGGSLMFTYMNKMSLWFIGIYMTLIKKALTVGR